MNQLSEILDEKGTDVLQIEADASVFEAVKRMVEANVGSLLVTEGGKITGIVTERDYLRRVTLEGRTDRETAVREIMSSPLIVVSPQTTIDACMALMTDQRISPRSRRRRWGGCGNRLDRRPRQVQVEAAELRDSVSDRLHHRALRPARTLLFL